ncbi:ribonuclease H-like protein [Mycena polygramma]|nr:ribonuclease H-like protein [Mycena polygramma]
MDERLANQDAFQNDRAVTFDPNLTLTSLALGFRVFVNKPRSKKPADQLPRADNPQDIELTVYAGGTFKIDTDGDPVAGGGVWFAENSPKNRSIGVRRDLSTRTGGILSAVLYVIQSNPSTTILNFVLQSKHVVSKLTVALPKQESDGWIGEKDKTLLMAITAALRVRGNRCTFRVADNKDDRVKFKCVQTLANIAMNGDPEDEYIVDPDELYTDIPSRYQLQGLSLANTSQATFYAAIRATHTHPERMKTIIMLDRTRYAVNDQCGKTPQNEDIWKSIRDRDIDRRVRNFLWKSMHQSYKCGEYWRSITNFEQLAVCHSCNVDDSLEHSLVECSAPGQEIIWSLCMKLWNMKHREMPTMSIGLIMGCGLTRFKDSKGKNFPGANRLFKIIVSESAYLIWKLRCERVIQHKSHTESEIHNRWVTCLNNRLKIDRLLTDRSRYGDRALNFKTVLDTWDGVLMDNKNLPENWIWQSGVLVGIGKFRPPGRNR